MNFNDNEEELEFLNCLLDRLRQAGFNANGSHLQLVYVAPGAQHINTQYVEAYPQPLKPHPLTPSPKGKGVDSAETASRSAHHKGGEVEERIRQCIAMLMAERYGEEPLFCLQGHWQAVYRILVDKGYCRDSDFDGFDAFIRRVMPEEVNKPYKKDSVRNINKTSFNKPFDRWRYDPNDYGTRKPFERMVAIARRFKEILDGNGL